MLSGIPIFFRDTEVSSECMLTVMDQRLIKQLVFGKIDIVASVFSSVHYLPEIFMRIIRTNLRTFYLSQETKEFLEGNMGSEFLVCT